MGLQNIGLSGLLLIVIVLVLVFGPSKLPELGKAFGRSLKEFREATRGISEDISVDGPSAKDTQSHSTSQPSNVQAAEPIELKEPEAK